MLFSLHCGTFLEKGGRVLVKVTSNLLAIGNGSEIS